MKKIVYIGMLFLGMVITSCTKTEVAPVAQDRQEAPTWSSSSEKACVSNSPEGTEGNEDVQASGAVKGSGFASDNGSDITDPNNDPEAKKKKP